MDGKEAKKLGVVVGGAALVAAVVARLAAPSSHTVTYEPTPRAREALRAAPAAHGGSAGVFFDDLEMPPGASCTITPVGSGRAASCTMLDGRAFDCEHAGSSWTCRPAKEPR